MTHSRPHTTDSFGAQKNAPGSLIRHDAHADVQATTGRAGGASSRAAGRVGRPALLSRICHGERQERPRRSSVGRDISLSPRMQGFCAEGDDRLQARDRWAGGPKNQTKQHKAVVLTCAPITFTPRLCSFSQGQPGAARVGALPPGVWLPRGAPLVQPPLADARPQSRITICSGGVRLRHGRRAQRRSSPVLSCLRSRLVASVATK